MSAHNPRCKLPAVSLGIVGSLFLALGIISASVRAEVVPAMHLPVVMGSRPAAECAPSYPTICIPPAPPDLDCDEIPYTNIPTLPPDEHHLDSDKDGIGCESPP